MSCTSGRSKPKRAVCGALLGEWDLARPQLVDSPQKAAPGPLLLALLGPDVACWLSAQLAQRTAQSLGCLQCSSVRGLQSFVSKFRARWSGPCLGLGLRQCCADSLRRALTAARIEVRWVMVGPGRGVTLGFRDDDGSCCCSAFVSACCFEQCHDFGSLLWQLAVRLIARRVFTAQPTTRGLHREMALQPLLLLVCVLFLASPVRTVAQAPQPKWYRRCADSSEHAHEEASVLASGHVLAAKLMVLHSARHAKAL